MAENRLVSTDECDQILSDVLQGDREIRRVSAAIRKEQAKLRAAVPERAWFIYLRVEELSNHRLTLVGRRLLRRR